MDNSENQKSSLIIAGNTQSLPRLEDYYGEDIIFVFSQVVALAWLGRVCVEYKSEQAGLEVPHSRFKFS